MKIRNGFVSNSSSSSFLLKIPFVPTSEKDVEKLLFGDNPPILLTYYDDEAIPSRLVANRIYKDIISYINSNPTFDVLDENKFNDLDINSYTIDSYINAILPEYRNDFNNIYAEYKKKSSKLEENVKALMKSGTKYMNALAMTKDESKIVNELEDKIKNIVIESVNKSALSTDIFIPISYSDNNGKIDSFIEHSHILSPITVYKISNH